MKLVELKENSRKQSDIADLQVDCLLTIGAFAHAQDAAALSSTIATREEYRSSVG
jgi:hypothetical protein